MTQDIVGKILNIALRSRPRGPMTEVDEAHAVANGGLVGDVASRPDRGITLLASEQWVQVVEELGERLPWHTRRANVLVESAGLGDLCGKTIRVGEVQVRVCAETNPCRLMDRLHPGLLAALTPEARGGVYGRILNHGVLRVGDVIHLDE